VPLRVLWFPYALQFNVGANLAVGDVNFDGYADIVTGATAGNPHTKVHSGKDLATGAFKPEGSSLLAEWFPYALAVQRRRQRGRGRCQR
jgi:FG-GAP repeat protein